MSFKHFEPSLFGFLRQLKTNNTREWFAENKPRYVREVREPVLSFVADFATTLAKVSTELVADPRPVGGSMFRIYRDTRFSKDKSPYKTHVGLQFRHRQARDVHTPGYYLHLEPGEVFAAAGTWRPDAPTLASVRAALVGEPARWSKAVTGAAFRRSCRFEGEVLKRPPRGFDPDHPLIEQLKRKDFVVASRWTEADVLSPGLMGRLSRFCRTTAPFMRLLTEALGLEF